jgi:hypothetical protein
MLHTLHISIVDTSIKINPVLFINRSNHLKAPLITAMIRIIARIERKIRALIHSGESTHTQDQEIMLVSLRPMKRIVNHPVNPIPELTVVLFAMMLFKLKILYNRKTGVSTPVLQFQNCP